MENGIEGKKNQKGFPSYGLLAGLLLRHENCSLAAVSSMRLFEQLQTSIRSTSKGSIPRRN